MITARQSVIWKYDHVQEKRKRGKGKDLVHIAALALKASGPL